MITAKLAIQNIKINSLELTCSAFLLLSPFLTWITLVILITESPGFVLRLITGFAVQSNLFDIASYHAGMNIAQSVASSALISALLLLSGGLIILIRKVRIGLSVATFGLILFAIISYPIFGTTNHGRTTTAYISAGIGFFVALVGIVIGVVALRIPKRHPIGLLIKAMKTREGLIKAGLFISAVSIVLDGLNHTALGQLSNFLDTNTFEMTLHFGFYLSLALLAVWFIFHQNSRRLVSNYMISGLLLALLPVGFFISDAIYHTVLGEYQAFIGHNSVETILHILTYYGLAAITIGTLLLRH